MRFWCGDFETDDWVLALPVDNLMVFLTALVLAGVAFYFYRKDQKKREADAKAKKEAEDMAQKLKDDSAKAKSDAETKKKIEDDKLAVRKDTLKEVNEKLRELQDGHRITMISDNYNRIMWIAEGIQQARDVVENVK